MPEAPTDTPLSRSEALAEPVVSPRRIWELPAAVAFPSTSAPERIVAFPVNVLAPPSSKGVLAEFWVTVDTLDPTVPAIVTPTSKLVLVPVETVTGVVPVPEFVIVPTLLAPPVSVRPLAMELLLLRTRFPVPATEFVTVRIFAPLALLLLSVVPPLFTFSVVIVRADVPLLSVTPVTLLPIIAMVVVPVLVPVLVTVPELLTDAVVNEIVRAPAVAELLLTVKLLDPVTPPLNVAAAISAVLPIVNVPVVFEANVMGLA
jgi:hypothetical protein